MDGAFSRKSSSVYTIRKVEIAFIFKDRVIFRETFCEKFVYFLCAIPNLKKF